MAQTKTRFQVFSAGGHIDNDASPTTKVKPLYPAHVQTNEDEDDDKKSKVTTNKSGKVKPLPTTGNWENFED